MKYEKSWLHRFLMYIDLFFWPLRAWTGPRGVKKGEQNENFGSNLQPKVVSSYSKCKKLRYHLPPIQLNNPRAPQIYLHLHFRYPRPPKKARTAVKAVGFFGEHAGIVRYFRISIYKHFQLPSNTRLICLISLEDRNLPLTVVTS